MKSKIVFMAAVTALTIQASQSMQGRVVYDEVYSNAENHGADFTPVRRPAANADTMAYERMHENYTAIARQNRGVMQNGGYKTLAGTVVKLPKPHQIQSQKVSGATLLPDNTQMPARPRLNMPARPRLNMITLKEQNTFAAVEDIARKGGKVAALNFANAKHPGGGYLHGSNAQEEDLCRRSTLYPILQNHQRKGEYPIAHDELIYSKEVMIIRDSYENEYHFLDNPIKCDVITQAAYDLNHAHGSADQVSDLEFQQGTVDKIRTQLRIAAKNGNDSLVVGAFGCGAFKNPPEFIALMYAEILNEPEFQGVFNEIRFAILGKTNFNVFKETLSTNLGNRFRVL